MTGTVLDRLREQVRQNPGNLAIRQRDRELTYEQLDDLSDRLAGYLHDNGIAIGTLVPICLSSPFDMVVGIWGILKAGGAYVPIDADFPVDRIRYMIGDTAAKMVISDSSSASFLAAAADSAMILADDSWAVIKNGPRREVSVAVRPDDLAYVIYTSGSTGLPKGVLIEHRSVIDYLDGLFRRIPYSSCRSFTIGVSFAADSVITHLFGSAILGGELHLFSKEDYNNVGYVHRYFEEHNIDCLKIVPSHWKSLSHNGRELLPRKVLMFGGEALYTAMVKDVIPATARNCMLINHYGPTETTVGQLLHVIEEGKDYGHTIPIGRTFTDARIHIMTSGEHEAKNGETGELYISGTCVARGYLNRPDLTGQRFVNESFGDDAAARFYRTGDLVKREADGEIVFLGRMDDQVKIRGYRIELGEIENVLQKAPGVKQCVVLARESSIGEKRLVGYVVCPAGYDKRSVTGYLESKLPAHMVPQLLVNMPELPFFPNGKVDKKALPNPDASTLLTNTYIAPSTNTESQLAAIWKEVLGVERAGAGDNFFELGGSSLLALKTVALLNARHSLTLPVVKLFQFPRIKELAAFLDGKTATVRRAGKSAGGANADVAVIGMAGRFPGAASVQELWDILENGRETTKFFTDEELDAAVSPALRNNPGYVKARGILDGVKGFDEAFFGITPRMAELMDPQQRIFLEVAWEAMEMGGYAPGKFNGTVGVFAGVRYNTYYTNNVLPNTALVDSLGSFQVMTLNDKDFVATRTAYTFDLKGPAVNVQAACSTSLVAVAQAVQSIRNGQCDMALAGGAAINAPVNVGHLYEEGAMLSNDGHCRPFDAEAKGTVFSDGAGVVLLKGKEQAIRDGDTIFAVIKGIGLSNDGGGKGSFTAPSAEGQAKAISMAIEDAGVDPADISYIETHGTATPLGDPIEIEGLTKAFGDTLKKQYCAIGSVKSNFGHLTTAAGVTGLIKACLALHHKKLPPSINFTKPNPHIDFASGPFYVNTRSKAWSTTGKRIAGVSSFGVGGTNAHVVLEEGDGGFAESGASRGVQLLCWSAKAERSLGLYGGKLKDYIAGAGRSLADIAYTLHSSREDLAFRRFAVASSVEELAQVLDNKLLLATCTKQVKEQPQRIVFMFPGQGDQYVNMCLSLYRDEPVFRDAMDECAGILKHELGEDIRSVIYPAEANDDASQRVKHTGYSQPALFSIGYALGKLWMSWGIYPSAFAGHSIGEFVAAYFAGVFSLADALKLIAARGRMMGVLPGGSMLSVRLSAAEMGPYLSGDIALAAVNSPGLCVVAGSYDAIAALGKVLDEKAIANRLLSTSHAFHSHMMDSVVGPFEEIVRTVALREPLIPIVSTVTGEWLKNGEATDPGYWAKHLRSPVLFSNAVQKLLDESYGFFIELGPGKSVSTLARQQAAGMQVTVISSIEKEETDMPSARSVLRALGQVWMNGVEPDWKAFYASQKRRRLHDLPTYAFSRQDHWVDAVPRHTVVSPQALVIEPLPVEHSGALAAPGRRQLLINKIKEILENASGIEMTSALPDMTFIEMGLDSLLLTNVALMLKRRFALPITFRQLNEELGTLALLAAYLDLNSAHDIIPKADMAGAPVAREADLRTTDLTPEEEVEIKKPFGAAARIEKQSPPLTERQQAYLASLTERYNNKTKNSKAYTQRHRAYMADPRVVSGFRPATKELVYSLVIKRSLGSRLWDIDDNEYIDALNGFGSNMLGYQPAMLRNAIIAQAEKGYEIGPQHELAGEVCKLICEFTGHDRSALCNTGSEAVLGAMRVARTVTGRSTIVAFAGSYHGIADEVIVRGSRKLKSYPAAPGIMPEAVQNMLILEYGTDESLRIIEERAYDLAAVLVEPVQSRRCDFQPIGFLKKLRAITKTSGTVLIFDEVISGFRFHPGGIQAMFGIKADLGTYGKVIGGGLSIGVIAGKKRFMDALDGGWWQYGDDSIPESGVTYFAGTFVRHPLALAAAKASLDYLQQQGPKLQERLNGRGLYIASEINAISRKLEVPVFIAQFGSLWRIRFLEEYPYMELFFVLMRYKGIHIQEGFPCFLTTAHTDEDIQAIIRCFEESLTELKDAGFIPRYVHPPADENKELNIPPIPGARLGKDKDGNPAWFVEDEKNTGKYLQVITEITRSRNGI